MPGGTSASRAGGRMARERRPSQRQLGFWRWFRTLPILAMVITLVICAGASFAPASVLRNLVFPVRHAESIEASCSRYGVDPCLVCAVIRCESNWDDEAQSSAGAVGLMQVMPDTARTLASWGLVDASVYDPENLTDPATNIEYGTAFLAYLSSQLSSTEEVIAAYNAGLGAGQEWTASGEDIADSIEFAETRIYLERVLLAYEGYQRCYPEGIVAEA